MNGIVFGSIILLASVGLSLLYGIGNFANFAHGEFLTLGAFITFAGYVTLGLPIYVAGFIAFVAVGLLGVALDRTLMARHRDSTPIVLLILTIGLALFLRAVIRLQWGDNQRTLSMPLEQGTQLLNGSFGWINYSLRLTSTDVIIVVLALLLATATHLFLTRTRMGIAMRATSDNKSLAKVAGIDTENVMTVTWALSGALAGAGGMLLAMQTGVLFPRMGFNIVLVVFAAVILGGIGSPYGAMLGAYIIGIAQETSIMIPGVAAEYRYAFAFLIMIAVLLYKPEGIAGGRW
ncbi:branched-chain amino acid ABC transporter permease [Halobacterium sp. KA-6]|uniref:branched-chain amino acid ABC transporter permease n=1 Tax=Halobacterium sp. KA-6 TaxID=2896368 RepID=UPI001E56A165|nr:branched-chain amino acid ABC transporter permease [Halobacterium sp. KA-6]MCD2204587.1 branched-chain amino acid ABC transporter permease [Halobacterium sp. KA-6]